MRPFYLRRIATSSLVVALLLSGANSVQAENPPPTQTPPAVQNPADPQKPAVPPLPPPTNPPPTPGSVTAPAKPGEGPQIVFDTPTYEFGRVMSGEPIRHDFWFTNRGNSLLEITAVRPGCGCTTAGQWDQKVEPGKTGKIPILLKTERMNGPIQKTISVTCNVPGSENVTLWLKGEVWMPIEVKPNFINFGSIADGKEKTQTASIDNKTDEPLELSNVKSDNPMFRVEVKPVKPGQQFELKVSALPPFNMGSNRANISIDTNSSKLAKLTIPIMCYVPAAVEANPQKLILPQGAMQQAVDRAVYVTNNTEKPLKITNVKVSDEKVATTLHEDMPGKRFRIVMKFPVGFSVPDNDALKLSFETDNENHKSFSIPIGSIRTTPVAAKPNNPQMRRPIEIQRTTAPPPASGTPAQTPGTPPKTDTGGHGKG
ncbi:MAG: DUF1573 domain-containing protein [Phycisphaerae bacterium]|nr:DUF1573 domain-containing protein [Phycisphaerae bacterium]